MTSHLNPTSLPVKALPWALPLVAAAVAVALQSPAFAAGEATANATGGASSSGATTATAQSTPSAKSVRSAQATQAAQTRRDVRLSRMLDRDVRNPQGDDLGDIEDIVIDARTNTVEYVVIEYGGFLDIGDKLFAFPLPAFSAAKPDRAIGPEPILPRSASIWRADNDLVLNVDQRQLENAPGFAEELWPNFNESGYRAQVDRYWQVQSPAPDSPDSRDKPRAAEGVTIPLTWRASDLLGARVVGEMGRDIGSMADVVVDLQSGKLQYAVISFDNGWFDEDKLVAVPADSLTPQGRGRVSLASEKEQIANAPSFDRSRWPDLNDAGYRSVLDRYLGEWGHPAATIDPSDSRTSRDSRSSRDRG